MRYVKATENLERVLLELSGVHGEYQTFPEEDAICTDIRSGSWFYSEKAVKDLQDRLLSYEGAKSCGICWNCENGQTDDVCEDQNKFLLGEFMAYYVDMTPYEITETEEGEFIVKEIEE